MTVLAVCAVSEAALAVALLLDPPLVFRLLLEAEASGTAVVAGRLAGIALLGLALACWPERDANDRAALRAMLFYNALATLYLAYLGLAGERAGLLLWPAALVHAVLTAYCFVTFRRREQLAR